MAFSYVTSWLANTYPGGVANGATHVGNWVQDRIWDLFVQSDGTAITNSNWDENGGEACVIDANGVPNQPTNLGTGGFIGMHAQAGARHIAGAVANGDIVWLTAGSGLVGRYSKTTRNFAGVSGFTSVSSGPCFGLGLNSGANELYVCAPSDNKVYVLNATTMAAVRNWAFTAPGKITVDGSGNLWIARTTDGKVYKYSATGVNSGVSITLPGSGIASALAISSTGKLMIGDNGPNQQIVLYDISGAPALSSTFGASGGLYSGTPGAMGPLKFYAPVGVGTDGSGNIYVACGLGRTLIRKFTSGGSLIWEISGNTFVDGTDFDHTTDGVDVYGIFAHYAMDYSQSNGGEWSMTGMSINPLLYPNDPRIFGPELSGFGYLQDFVVIGGVKFLTLTDQYGSYLMMFRLNGEIAIPSFIFAPVDKFTGQGYMPGVIPVGQSWLWRDANGNGNIEAGEIYDVGGEYIPAGWNIDSAGNVWQCFGNNSIRRFNLQGQDAHGNPEYDYAHTDTFTVSNISEIRRVEYDAGADTLYLSGFNANFPNSADPSGKNGGRIFAAYPNWSTGNRNASLTIQLPYYDPSNYGAATTWDIAGGKLFVGVQASSGVSQGAAPHNVYVFDLATGALDGECVPSATVGDAMGFLDGIYVLHAFQRASGEYLVTQEEVVWNKQILYRIGGSPSPPPPPPPPPSPPLTGFAAAIGSLSVLRDYQFGTGAGKNVTSISDLNLNFDPYGIAGTTPINQEWERYAAGPYLGPAHPNGVFQSTNWVFSAGSLDLTATIPGGGGLSNGGINSAQILSQETFQPGVTGSESYAFECRMKIPSGQGFWPAHWFYMQSPLFSSDGSEIDNPEFFNMPGYGTGALTCNQHGPGQGGVIFSALDANGIYRPGTDFSAAFHDYQTVWTTDSVYKFIDGVLIFAQKFTWTSGGPAQFIVNLACGSDLAGLPGLQPTSLGEFPSALSVDHITVWSGNVVPPLTPPSPTPTPVPPPPAPPPPTPAPPPVPATPTASASAAQVFSIPKLTSTRISLAVGITITSAAGNLIVVAAGAVVDIAGGGASAPTVKDQLGNSFLQATWVNGQIFNPGIGIFYRQNMPPGPAVITFEVLVNNGNPIFAGDDALFITVKEVPLPLATLKSAANDQQGGAGPLTVTVLDSHGNPVVSDGVVTYSNASMAAAVFSAAPRDYVGLALLSGGIGPPSTTPAVSPGQYSPYVLGPLASEAAFGDNLAFYSSGINPPLTVPPFPPGAAPPDWLIINEPALGQTDRTNYLFKGDGTQHNWSMQLRQRGQASVGLYVAAGDDYSPTRGTQLWLYDESEDGFILVFSGLIQDYEIQWQGTNGDRYIVITAVSLESIFDTVYATPKNYQGLTTGAIVADLYNSFETGAQVSLGNIEDGPVIALFNTNFEKLSDLFDQLATAAGKTWNVQLVNGALAYLNFQKPAVFPSPWVVNDAEVLWESANWKINGADYRNRQAIRINFDAFAHSAELFTGTGQTVFTLLRPVEQVTNAWATLSTQNHAAGAFTTQPNPGDTVTIGLPSGLWQANHAYALGGALLDSNNHVQTVIGAGTSGALQPVWNKIGGSTNDHTVIWHDLGPAGLGTGLDVYTFVGVVDNTQFGQVLIGATVADTCRNLIDAINSNQAVAGLTFSLPTFECSLCNATLNTGAGFTLVNKSAGTSYLAAISRTGTAFAWSAPFTSGGTSPQGSLGPGEGATIALNVGILGQPIAAPGLAYTPGSNVVSLATPLNVGSYLQVEYTRAGGDVIQVEDTPAVVALAALSHGTGKYQQIFSGSNSLVATSPAAALILAQQALAAFEIAPSKFAFDTYKVGLMVGQVVDVSMLKPIGGTGLLNGSWVIEEINAELAPVNKFFTGTQTYPLGSKTGHYKYTVRCVNIQEIGSFLDFWNGLGGGGSSGGGAGGAGGSALVATNGGAINPVAGTPTAVEISGVAVGTENILNLIPGGDVVITGVDNTGAGSIDVTIATTAIATDVALTVNAAPTVEVNAIGVSWDDVILVNGTNSQIEVNGA